MSTSTKIAPAFDAVTLKQIITADFPQLKIKKLTVYPGGYDNMVTDVISQLYLTVVY